MPDHEYVAARSVLLDALNALGSQRESFILVGAQAVYAHTGEVEGTGINRTTDGDLALNTELLHPAPELTTALETAGFTPDTQPGSWVGTGRVKIDIMTVPHQSNTLKKGARSAKLPPHGKQLARITPGLEAALVDSDPRTIDALDLHDQRSFTLAVAGPAALLVAKAIKIQERNRDPSAGRQSRISTKDSVDCLRLLTTTEPDTLIAGFRRHRAAAQAEAVSLRALRYFQDQHAQGDRDEIRVAIHDELDDPVMAARYTALIEEFLHDCRQAKLL